jgi:hypothetical protein
MVTISTSSSRRTRREVLRQSMESAQRIVVLGVVILILLLALVNQHDNAQSSIMLSTSSSEDQTSLSAVFDVTYHDESRPDLSQWEGCTFDRLSSPQPDGLKTFWVPMYPNSDGGMIGNLIRLLTENPKAHKNYYAKAPGLKKCISAGSITISCEQVHPVVGIGPPPEQQISRYQPKILLGIRHPLTAIPAHLHDKAVKYHGATKQVDIDEWRNFRDAHFANVVRDSWRWTLSTWKELGGNVYYEPEPFYLPYEHLLDAMKGPALTERLAVVLRTAGYHTVTNTGCVWYHAVKDKLLRPIGNDADAAVTQQPQRHPHYDYADSYIPSLTREQKVALMDELNDIRQTYPTDRSLNELLAEYIDIVQNERRTDIPWVNQTAVAAAASPP